MKYLDWFSSNGKVLFWPRLILLSSCLSLSQPCAPSVGTVTGRASRLADLAQRIPGAASASGRRTRGKRGLKQLERSSSAA